MIYFNNKKVPKIKLDNLWNNFKAKPRYKACWFAGVLELVFGNKQLKNCNFTEEPRHLDPMTWNKVKMYAKKNGIFKITMNGMQ